MQAQRINPNPALHDLKMQMVARAVPRTAHIADDLPLLHLLSGCDTDAGAVRVQSSQPAAVVQLDVVKPVYTGRALFYSNRSTPNTKIFLISVYICR